MAAKGTEPAQALSGAAGGVVATQQQQQEKGTKDSSDPAVFEAEHVHEVYEEIASHFSSTRYKPWPVVEKFLEAVPAGSVGVDAGCGNGKYLPVNRNAYCLASDRSTNLVQIARQHQPHDALVADLLNLPHPAGAFDFVLSIAAIHHLSTRARRVEAVRSLLDLLVPHSGRVLIFVWALEQRTSRRGWSESDAQDVMVPWVRRTNGTPESTAPQQETFQRYYHLYKKGELEQDIEAAGGAVVDANYEKDNWWAVAKKVM